MHDNVAGVTSLTEHQPRRNWQLLLAGWSAVLQRRTRRTRPVVAFMLQRTERTLMDHHVGQSNYAATDAER
jgi:hypothetical protein